MCILWTLAEIAVGHAFEWQSATPESQGFSSEKLDKLKDSLVTRHTRGLLVIRNDKIVYEWYEQDRARTKPHYTASMAKAIVGGVSLAVAISDGRIRLDDRASKYVPQWARDPLKGRITIRHLGSHTSGIEDANSENLPHEQLTGWQGDFWKRKSPPHDPFTIARDRAPVAFPPGTDFAYSNPGIAMLSYAVTRSLHDTDHPDVRSLLRDRIMRPLEVPEHEWSCGYEQTFKVDGLPLVAAWGGGRYSPNATARVARLMMRRGDWDGRQLISAQAVKLVTTDAGTPKNCGMGWWNNGDGNCPSLPRDAFWGSGAGGQVVLVVPSLNLIAVRNGESLAEGANEFTIKTYFFTPLMECLSAAPNADSTSLTSCPPSPVIAEIKWAPPESILRLAKGSDNWPLTWADDGNQYTAYGDGWGFDPKVTKKLSLGLARVSGPPEQPQGINIRSPSGEQVGQGAQGKKASGMLMAGSTLYLLARNAENSQLAWSRDYGKTWAWADWRFETSFGCPTFLNFGMNYAGARDQYVYVYSHDSESAYAAADRVLLARVPVDCIRDRSAYEFFSGMDSRGRPQWTSNVVQCGGVHRNPGRCYRLSVSYCAPLHRYLLVYSLGGNKPVGDKERIDTRFHGGIVVLDAPEPWGPWTTVYSTSEWDVGPGETCSFPVKWMSEDGKTLHLVSSGDDCFSVRRASVELQD